MDAAAVSGALGHSVISTTMVVAILTPDEAMKELDRDLEKTCEIMGLLYHNYGIELSDEEFDKVFDIINR